MTSSWRRRPIFAVPVLAFVLASCGGYGDPAAPGESPSGDLGSGAEPTVAAARSTFGEIVVDAGGNTLYAFTQDTGGVSTCYDECAATWPALVGADELRAGDGIERSLLGTTTRSDGSEQVTYADMPLYRFAGDARPADTAGQGIGGVWFVVSPVGEVVEAPAPRGGYGYGTG